MWRAEAGNEGLLVQLLDTEGAGRRYLLLGVLGMSLKQIGSIVLCCVEGVIIAGEGERSHCSVQSSGDTGTLSIGSLRLCCRDSRTML